MRWTPLILFVILANNQPVGAQSKRPPNIVIILADDLGYGDLGCQGHRVFKTPAIDKLAEQGARFTHFSTPTPYCAPTRASLLTGRYPFRHGLTGNPAPDGGTKADALALAASEVMLAQLLRQAGYATGMVGKWHLGHQKSEYLPTARGFDQYLGIPYSNDMRPVALFDGAKKLEYPVVQCNLTQRYTDWALDFIQRNKDRPFFLYLAHLMPHKPLACSEGYYKKSGAGLYADVMAELDAGVGQVLARLKDLGLDDNTLVIFTSDNGPWYGGSTGGLRGMKGTLWEGGHRVPCLVRWNGKIPPGQVRPEMAIMMDLFPTALAAAGVNGPDRVIDGKNLLPLLTGKGKLERDVLFAMSADKIGAVRDDRFKLYVKAVKDRGEKKQAGERWIDPRGPDGVTILAPYEQYQPTDYPGIRSGAETNDGTLFDLRDDPSEQRDVSAKYPDAVRRLREQYERMVREFPGVK